MFCEGNFIPNVREKLFEDIDSISKKVENLIIVTDYLFSDGIIYDSYTEAFRKEIGRLNINLCKISDVVIECSFNNEIIHKGKNMIRKIK